MAEPVPVVPGSSTTTVNDPVGKSVRQYGIVKGILEYLPMRDLTSASKVCPIWSEVGNIVRAQRPFGPALIPVHRFPADRLKDLIMYSNNVDVNPSSISWIRANLHRSPQAERDALLDFLPAYMKSNFEKLNYFIDPENLVLIGTPVLQKMNRIRREQRDQVLSTLESFTGGMSREIPSIISISGSGVLYGQANSVEVRNVIDMRKEFGFMAGLVIPKIEGVGIRQFCLRPERVQEISDPEVLLNIKDGDVVRAIILFVENRAAAASSTEKLMRKYIGINPDVELGGGVLFETWNSLGARGQLAICSGLVFTGSALNIKSICLREKGVTAANQKLILQFKDANMEESGSYAFVFCCCGRTRVNEEQTPVELVYFKEQYPKTTVIGAMSEGEFYYSKPSDPDGAKNSRTKKNIALRHSYVCVIVFVAGLNAH